MTNEFEFTIKEKIKDLEDQRQKLFEHQKPKGFSNGMSYVDADNIHGNGRKGAEEVFLEYQELTHQINDLSEQLRSQVDFIDTVKDKVLYLVNVCGYNQKEAAEMLGYSHDRIRHIKSS